MNCKIDLSVLELWKHFIQMNSKFRNRTRPQSWHFCDNKIDANECAELVVNNIKQATSTSMWWYETNDHAFPTIGDLSIITNWEKKAKAIIQTSKIEKVPFNKITREYAEIEGEGDKSLAYWKRVHWDYYTREMKEICQKPYNEMLIICEQFETIWTENMIVNKK